MSGRTDQLIRELTRDVAPVRRLPRLGQVALGVVGTAALLIAISLALAWTRGQPLVKPELLPHDLLGVLGHLVLAGGALGLGLASCIPGRERTQRAGLWGLAAGAALTLTATTVVLVTWVPGAVGIPFLRGTGWCTLTAVVPALVPAVMLALFAGRGAPARPLLTLACGAVATVGFATLPGHLGCLREGSLHTLLGHMLVPVSGGLLVLGLMRLLYRPSLPPVRR